MSAPTVEELRRQIEEEKATHKAAMEAIAEQTRKFQAVLSEDQQAFTELITRVTTLRVAKGECLAARAAGRTQQISFSTGSDLLDGFLYAVQAKLDSPGTSTGASVLQKLETAALEAMTPYAAHRLSALFTSNAAAVRHTNVLLLFPNDVRGVRTWARKHFGSCAGCAARQAQVPPWVATRYDSKSTGMAAAPNLRAIPGKHYHHLTCNLLQERSMADRMDTEQQLDLVRGTFFLHVQAAGVDQPLPDGGAAACAAMTDALQSFLSDAMTELRDTARTAAPWNAPTTANAELSAAMEILLHMIEPRVHVQAVPQPAACFNGTPCNLVQVSAAVSVPLQVSAVAPLLQVLHHPEQRSYLIEQVLTPLSQRLGAALGVGAVAAHYTDVGLKFAESLYRLAVHQGLVSAAAGAPPPSPSSPPSSTPTGSAAATLAQLYFVLQALAVFNTTVEVEMATPHLPQDTDSNCDAAQKTKTAALYLARSVLRRFGPPSPLSVPPANDPLLSELTVKICRAPTTFLETLNRTFSSNQRMPSTARSSALDTFMSPKSKISLGLKLFREIVVDVYRPYHPCTGVVLAAENGVGGRARAPPCVPVIDLPVDCVNANVAVATFVMAKTAELQQCEAALGGGAAASTAHSSAPLQQQKQDGTADAAAAAAAAAALEKAGREALHLVAEKVRRAELVARLKGQWTQLGAKVVECPKACVDVIVPFSMTEVDVRNATKPLLYLRVVYEC